MFKIKHITNHKSHYIGSDQELSETICTGLGLNITGFVYKFDVLSFSRRNINMHIPIQIDIILDNEKTLYISTLVLPFFTYVMQLTFEKYSIAKQTQNDMIITPKDHIIDLFV